MYVIKIGKKYQSYFSPNGTCVKLDNAELYIFKKDALSAVKFRQQHTKQLVKMVKIIIKEVK
jgi:hypothetical protein